MAGCVEKRVQAGRLGVGLRLLPRGAQKPVPACTRFSSPFLLTHFLPQRGLGSWVTRVTEFYITSGPWYPFAGTHDSGFKR